MLEISVVDATVRAVDRANNAVEIETVGWDQPAPDTEIPFPVDGSISGRVTRLTYESSGSMLLAVDDGSATIVTEFDAMDHREFADRHNLVRITSTMQTFLSFEGPATFTLDDTLQGVIDFPHPTPVTIGFRSLVNAPRHTVTVPSTPAGLATALTYFSADYVGTDPQRSGINHRGHPPRIEYGDSVEVPAAVSQHTEDVGIELVLPDEVAAVIPAASLATYLGADVTVEDRTAPLLRAADVDLAHEFDPLPAFQHEAAALLRRVYFLDNLVEWLTETGDRIDWLEADALAVLDLDPERCEDLSLAERLRTYLSVDFERVSSIFPAWLSAVYVKPTFENAAALPYIVAHLSQPYLPDASPDRLPRSASSDGAGRDAGRPTGPATTLGPGIADDPAGPYVGWLGEDPPEWAYQASVAAYRNRESFLDDREEIDVTVAVTDPDRPAVRDRVLDHYRHEDPIPVTLSVLDDPTTSELADRIEDSVDFLHVIGPCHDGLACADGTLRPVDLPASNVRAFFLDGPGGARTGHALLRQGSVAGAVWPAGTDVDQLDAHRDGTHDVTVRSTFLRSLVGGFTIDLARRYAARYGDGAVDPIVVGDGMLVLPGMEQSQVLPMEVTHAEDGLYRVRIPVRFTQPGKGFGGMCLQRWQLGGSTFDRTLTAAEIRELLDSRWYLLVADDTVYRPDEVGPFYPIV